MNKKTTFRLLPESESRVMKCIWDEDKPVTCLEVLKLLKSKYGYEYAETTVYTFLNNLKNKGYVESYKKKITYFKAKRTENEYLKDLLKNTIDFWFDGNVDSFVEAVKK